MVKRAALTLLLAPTLLACGSSGQQGYLSQPNPNSVQFLQVTRNGNNLSGDYESATIPDSDPTTVNTVNASFTGTTDGSQMTLTFQQGLGFETSISGSYSGSNIDLSIPQNDGTLATEDFAPSDTNAYNSIVHTLQQQAQQTKDQQDAAAAAQQAAQQQAAREAAERDAVDKAIGRVNSDTSAISSDINQYNGLQGQVSNDLKQAYNDTITAYNDMKKVQAEGASSDTCGGDATVVAGDATVVAGDLTVVNGDQTVEQGDKQTVTNDVSRLDADFQALQSAMSAIPSYQPGGTPTASQVSQAHSAASKANSEADAMITAALKQAQGWVNQANQYAASAAAVCP